MAPWFAVHARPRADNCGLTTSPSGRVWDPPLRHGWRIQTTAAQHLRCEPLRGRVWDPAPRDDQQVEAKVACHLSGV